MPRSTRARFASASLFGLILLTLTASPSLAHPPVVIAPATVAGTELVPLSFTVTASDPDGERIESLTAAPLPTGATFVTNSTHTIGTFSWSPAVGQAGTYSITFTARNLRVGTATTSITVARADRPPAVSAPLGINGEEGGAIAFSVSASDADGDAIQSLTADLSVLPVGNDASFTPDATNTSGNFIWHMQPGDAGTYSIVFTAANGLSASATTVLSVGVAGVGVTGLFEWTPQPGQEGVYSVVFTASDAGGTSTFTSTITVVTGSLSPSPAPSLSPRTPGTTLRQALQAPQAPQKGPIISGPSSVQGKAGDLLTVSVYATSDPSTPSASPSGTLRAASVSLASSATQAITLSADLSGLPPGNDALFSVDREPVVSGPEAVTVDAGVAMTVMRSAADPDGDPIGSFTADLSGLPAGNNAAFSVNASNTIGTLTWTPALADIGTFVVNFTAANRLVGHGSTAITVRAVAPCRVFMANPQKIRLGSNRPNVCVQLEPIDGSFALEDVNVATIRMVSIGTGSVSEIPAISTKSVLIGDRDNNLIPDMTVCFTKPDARQLFSLLHGMNTVEVMVRGQLTSGAYFAGTWTAEIIASSGPSLASVSIWPNPLNPQAKLGFTLSKPGFLRVKLYDTQGRLVRELVRETMAAQGRHEITIDGRDSDGSSLASGVYFFRIESAEGVTNGRLAIVR